MAFGRSYNPVWFMVDLNGKALDGTYFMFTLFNTLPYLPQTLAIDENGTPASNPIQFLANGTLPVDLYWDDEATYRIEIRQGNTQADPLIYEINNYEPLGAEGPTPPPADTTTTTDNQITNPQFSVLNFTGSLAISVAGTYNFAPGWYLDAAGSGTVTLSQRTYTGDEYTPDNATNASYGLRIVNNGFTSIKLRQRFNHNGALWTGADSLGSTGPGVAVNFTASSNTNFDLTVELEFSDSSTSPIATVPINNRINEDFPVSQPVVISQSAVAAGVAYTDLAFSYTGSLTFDITSVQLVAQDVVEDVIYAQTSLERQVDHMFHYYQPALNFKPISSLLTGWDFPLNPAQFGSTVAGISTTSQYVWDQTIMGTSASTVGVVRDVRNGNMTVTSGAINQAFYLLQYLTGAEALKTLVSTLSVNINAYSTIHNSVSVRCYLYNCGVSAGSIPTSATGATIGTVASDGQFSLSAAGWTAITPANGVNQAQTLGLQETSGSGDIQFLSYDGFSNYNVDASGTNFAIVVTFSCPTSGTAVNINSISCVPGDIATRPAPQTQDEVLRDCQYYYEMSYGTGGTTNPAGTNSTNNSICVAQAANLGLYLTPGAHPQENYNFTQQGFGLTFKQVKRVSPTLKVYSTKTLNTPNTVTAYVDYIYHGASGPGNATITADVTFATNYTATTGLQSLSFIPIIAQLNANIISTPVVQIDNATPTDYYWGNAYITYHYTADSRLGVV